MSARGESEDPVDSDDAIRALALAGEKVRAVGLYRAKHGVSLPEALSAVESLLADAPANRPDRRLDRGPDRAPRDLGEIGYELADEIRSGKWRHVAGIEHCPARDCPEILAEFRRRCPGHTPEQYRSALGQGFFDSR